MWCGSRVGVNNDHIRDDRSLLFLFFSLDATFPFFDVICR